MPSGSIQLVELYDNGASADTFAEDGIYSRYFVNATSMGRYTVECEIWGYDSTYVKEQYLTSSIKMTGRFLRMENGDSFKVPSLSRCL